MYVPMKGILEDANIHNYAVIAANCINFELARAIIDAANEMNSPIIVNVSQRQMNYHADGALLSVLIQKLAERTPIPIALNLDHGKTYEAITYAFRHGYSSVMIDASEYSLKENISMTKEVVKLAHSQDVSVEAELGHVGQANKGDQDNKGLYTEPLEAKHFIEETSVDALAVAVGTAHGSYPKGIEPKIDFARLKAIKEALKIPLVLHGGSNSGDENIKKAVQYGINKINVCTDTFNACRNNIADEITKNPNIDFMELMKSTELAGKNLIKHYIGLAGSAGKAHTI